MFGMPNPISAWYAQFKLYILLVLAIALVASGCYLTYRLMEARQITLEHERDNARQEAVNEKGAREQVEKDFKASEQQVREKGQRLIKSEKENAAFKLKLINLANSKTPGGDWLRLDIPVSVRELRRHDAGCPIDLSMPCPYSEPSRDPGTLDGGSDRPGASGGGGSVTPRPAILQFRQGSTYGLDSKGIIQEVGVVEVVKSGAKLPSLPKEPKHESGR